MFTVLCACIRMCIQNPHRGWFHTDVKPLIITTGKKAHKTLGCNKVNEQNIKRDTWRVHLCVCECMSVTAVREHDEDVLCLVCGVRVTYPNNAWKFVRLGCLLSWRTNGDNLHIGLKFPKLYWTEKGKCRVFIRQIANMRKDKVYEAWMYNL